MTGMLTVIEPGLHTTVQDFGRFGYQNLGVPVAGALDPISMHLANALVGNPAHEAVLEVLHLGPTFELASASVRVALVGGDAYLEADQLGALRGMRTHTLRQGQRFTVKLRGSACCYLAFAGGLDIMPCLGSCATYVHGKIGGYKGRALCADDGLALRLTQAAPGDELELKVKPPFTTGAAVRVIAGPQQDYFSHTALTTLTESIYTISATSDRMGLRLDGPKLVHQAGYDIVSDAIATGAIQVPGSGQPILLLADHQTTGGYAKIANVISADLAALGRRSPGDEVCFEAVTMSAAISAKRAEQSALAACVNSIAPAGGESAPDLKSLYAGNLISGVVSAKDR